MPGNRVYRGPADRQPKTVSNRPLAAALLPGTFVSILAASIAQATTPSGVRLGILGERDFYHGDPFATTAVPLTPYASGDTGIVYLPEPVQEYTCAMAAGTYTMGQELTVAANGRLAAAVTGNIVVAHYDDATRLGALAAGALADVIMANFYTKL